MASLGVAYKLGVRLMCFKIYQLFYSIVLFESPIISTNVSNYSHNNYSETTMMKYGTATNIILITDKNRHFKVQ